MEVKKKLTPKFSEVFEEYKEIYDRFWSDKTKVRKEDVGFMVKLINERKE